MREFQPLEEQGVLGAGEPVLPVSHSLFKRGRYLPLTVQSHPGQYWDTSESGEPHLGYTLEVPPLRRYKKCWK